MCGDGRSTADGVLNCYMMPRTGHMRRIYAVAHTVYFVLPSKCILPRHDSSSPKGAATRSATTSKMGCMALGHLCTEGEGGEKKRRCNGNMRKTPLWPNLTMVRVGEGLLTYSDRRAIMVVEALMANNGRDRQVCL